jgi:hypothetical protein
VNLCQGRLRGVDFVRQLKAGTPWDPGSSTDLSGGVSSAGSEADFEKALPLTWRVRLASAVTAAGRIN